LIENKNLLAETDEKKSLLEYVNDMVVTGSYYIYLKSQLERKGTNASDSTIVFDLTHEKNEILLENILHEFKRSLALSSRQLSFSSLDHVQKKTETPVPTPKQVEPPKKVESSATLKRLEVPKNRNNQTS